MQALRLNVVPRRRWGSPSVLARLTGSSLLGSPLLSRRNIQTTRIARLRSNDLLRWARHKDQFQVPDTIYALSTAPGRAAIAVIRISGPACLDIYGSLCPDKAFPIPRTATLRKICDPRTPTPLDDNSSETRILDPSALVLYFPNPHTATGDDILELHVHGGPAIVRSILDAIPHCTDSRPRKRNSEYSRIRPAEAGEFTKRAFYNGRLDLVQAEALGESLSAETEMQRRLAVGGQAGELGRRYEEWRSMLLYARGELEALIDFSEDQRFDESPGELVGSVAEQVMGLKRQVELHVQNARKGELLRDGISVALLGAPNAGKSSLLNLVVGREAAIVSAEAGTTRDIVDVSVDLAGWLVRFGDMAGLRRPRDTLSKSNGHTQGNAGAALQGSIGLVEQEGIRRARARALESDVVVVLVPVQLVATNGVAEANLSFDEELLDAVEQCRQAGKQIVFVLNKVDLLPSEQISDAFLTLCNRLQDTFKTSPTDPILAISCKQAQMQNQASPDPGGIQALLKALTGLFQDMTAASGDPHASASYWAASLSVSHRQATYLQECLCHLNDFLEQCRPPRAQATGVFSHHIDNHDDLVGEVQVSLETDLDHQDRPPIFASETQTEVDIVTAAEHLRAAALCLAKITGRGDGGDVEDVLGVVFEKFCVGK